MNGRATPRMVANPQLGAARVVNSRNTEPRLTGRCRSVVMGRAALWALIAGGVLVTSLATAAGARASGHVVITASPAEVDLGDPVEVLVRTFGVVDRNDLGRPFETPIAPYPVPSH